jgi:hypothetical protein
MFKRKFCSQWELSWETPYIYYKKSNFHHNSQAMSASAFGDGRLDALYSVGSAEDKVMGCGLLSVHSRDKESSVNVLWNIFVILLLRGLC